MLRFLRLAEFAMHASVPALAVQWLSQVHPLEGAWVVAGLFSVVLLWGVAFIFFQQLQYPNTVQEALPYTLFTVLQFGYSWHLESVAFSSYVYYLNTLLVLTLLLLAGALYIARSEKVVPGKAAMAGGLLVVGALVGLYTYSISSPLEWFLQSLELGWAALFVVGFVGQVVKLLVSHARFFKQERAPEPVSPLPAPLLVGGLLIATLLTGFTATF